MEIRSFIFLGLICFCQIGNAQGIEEQRKYVTENSKDLFDFILSSGEIEEFKTKHHSNYVYCDLYLDTPEYDLYKNGLSLRFRKRNEDIDSITYVFQLKTEMESENGIRLEVDEPELDFYFVLHDDKQISMANLLAQFFDEVFHSNQGYQSFNCQKIIKTISNWIVFKSGAPIAPFQKLQFLYPTIFNENKIASLTPVIYGMSKRIRSHIYLDIDRSNKYNLSASRFNSGSDLPAFFLENTSLIWVMESSIDSSVFYPMFNSTHEKNNIVEYELENKYYSDSLSTRLMNDFELAMRKRFDLVNTSASKYLQSISTFIEK